MSRAKTSRAAAWLCLIAWMPGSVCAEDASPVTSHVSLLDCYACIAGQLGGGAPASPLQGAYAFDAMTAVQIRAAEVLQESRPLEPSSPRQERILAWIRRWSGLGPISREMLPWAVLASQQAMYRAARKHALDAGKDILRTYAEAGDDPAWANCGDSADMVRDALEAFAVPSRRIHYWASLDDQHVGCQIVDPATGSWVYADPLYNVVMVDRAGNLASLKDLVEETRLHGWTGEKTQWRFVPVAPAMLVGLGDQDPAQDSRYAEYLQIDYRFILRNYLTVVADAIDDGAHKEMPVANAGGFVPRIRWLVYASTHLATQPEYFAAGFWEAFEQRYDAMRSGRYVLQFEGRD